MKIVKVLSVSMLMGLSTVSINAMLSPAQQKAVNEQLIDAAGSRNIQSAQNALNNGAQINAVIFGTSPLLRATTTGNNLSMVQFLVKKGAEVNSYPGSYQEMTPLHNASALSDNKEQANDTIVFLVKQGAKLDSPDKDGETPLHLAAKFGKLGAVKYLVESGADVTKQDNNKHTALKAAKIAGRKEVEDYLEGRTTPSSSK